MTKLYLIFLIVLFTGCQIPPLHREKGLREAEMDAANWPLMSPEYTKIDNIDGEWIQCPEEFYSKDPWQTKASLTVSKQYITLTVDAWRDSVEESKLSLFTLFFEYDDFPHSAHMFHVNKHGVIAFKIPRHLLYLKGGAKNNIDYVSLGTFDPPIVFRRK